MYHLVKVSSTNNISEGDNLTSIFINILYGHQLTATPAPSYLSLPFLDADILRIGYMSTDDKTLDL